MQNPGSISNHNIYIDQGTSFRWTAVVSNLNVNATYVCKAKRVYSEGPEFSIKADIDLNGRLVLSSRPEDTADLPAGKYYYDVLEYTEEDEIYKVMSGLATVVSTIS